jgi:hypothetical protein
MLRAIGVLQYLFAAVILGFALSSRNSLMVLGGAGLSFSLVFFGAMSLAVDDIRALLRKMAGEDVPSPSTTREVPRRQDRRADPPPRADVPQIAPALSPLTYMMLSLKSRFGKGSTDESQTRED